MQTLVLVRLLSFGTNLTGKRRQGDFLRDRGTQVLISSQLINLASGRGTSNKKAKRLEAWYRARRRTVRAVSSSSFFPTAEDVRRANKIRLLLLLRRLRVKKLGWDLARP
jgi:hypothetical protein